MLKHIFIVAALLAFSLMADRGYAQNVTVQQPVMNSFSVGTTVSVPDSGSSYLVGVGRAGSARTSFGPWRPGSTHGRFTEGSSMSVHVQIHDFETMDKYLLNSASNRSSGLRLHGPARDAYRSLYVDKSNPSSRRYYFHAGDQSIRSTNSVVTDRGRTSVSSKSSKPEVDANARATRYYRLGLNAEQKGSLGVARLHYRMAAKYGSQAASEKLLALSSSKNNLARSK